jgi:hypothetical protein
MICDYIKIRLIYLLSWNPDVVWSNSGRLDQGHEQAHNGYLLQLSNVRCESSRHLEEEHRQRYTPKQFPPVFLIRCRCLCSFENSSENVALVNFKYQSLNSNKCVRKQNSGEPGSVEFGELTPIGGHFVEYSYDANVSNMSLIGLWVCCKNLPEDACEFRFFPTLDWSRRWIIYMRWKWGWLRDNLQI